MKILLDTNVLMSSIAFGGKRSKEMLVYLLESNHEVLLSEYVYLEFIDKIKEKRPEKVENIKIIIDDLPFVICQSSPETTKILRDSKDDPILSDAIYNGADVIITNDKDFLESDIKKPQIISMTELIEMYDRGTFV